MTLLSKIEIPVPIYIYISKSSLQTKITNRLSTRAEWEKKKIYFIPWTVICWYKGGQGRGAT